MLGREAGRTWGHAVVGGDASVRSLAPAGDELWAAEPQQRPWILLAGDRHREARPAAEAVGKIRPFLSRRLRASLWHFRGTNTAEHGSTLIFPLSPGVPSARLSSWLPWAARRGDPSSQKNRRPLTHAFRDGPKSWDMLWSLLGSQVWPQRLPEVQNTWAPSPQHTAGPVSPEPSHGIYRGRLCAGSKQRKCETVLLKCNSETGAHTVLLHMHPKSQRQSAETLSEGERAAHAATGSSRQCSHRGCTTTVTPQSPNPRPHCPPWARSSWRTEGRSRGAAMWLQPRNTCVKFISQQQGPFTLAGVSNDILGSCWRSRAHSRGKLQPVLSGSLFFSVAQTLTLMLRPGLWTSP